MRAAERRVAAGPAPRADPRPRGPPRRGGHPAAAGGCVDPPRLPQAPPQGWGDEGGWAARPGPARRGRSAAVRVVAGAAVLPPEGRGLTEGHVPPPPAAGTGRRGGGARGSAGGGVCGGGGSSGLGHRQARQTLKLSVSPAAARWGPPEVGSRRRPKRAAGLQRGAPLTSVWEPKAGRDLSPRRDPRAGSPPPPRAQGCGRARRS